MPGDGVRLDGGFVAGFRGIHPDGCLELRLLGRWNVLRGVFEWLVWFTCSCETSIDAVCIDRVGGVIVCCRQKDRKWKLLGEPFDDGNLNGCWVRIARENIARIGGTAVVSGRTWSQAIHRIGCDVGRLDGR